MLVLIAKILISWSKGKKDISGLAPAPWTSCCTPLSSFSYGLAGVGNGGCREEVGRRSQAAQGTGSPYSHPDLSLPWEVLQSGAGETRKAEMGEWLKFVWPPWLSSLSTGDSIHGLGKALHSGRHRTTEWQLQGQPPWRGAVCSA